MTFSQQEKTVTLDLDRAYSHRDTLTVSIEYSCTPRKGLYFIQPDSAYPKRPRQIWSQGEDMDNHFWFPCYDFPNDRATSEMIATVPGDLTALSNGALLNVRENKKDHTKTFHWKETLSHPSYLITLAVGNYAVLKDKAGSSRSRTTSIPDRRPMRGYASAKRPPWYASSTRRRDSPYPWEKYAQVLIHEFIVGGMENASATSLADDATVFDARARIDENPSSLIAHELSHQWWGDVVTCKDWRHLWLNEGFASYFDPLYHESTRGRDHFDVTMYEAQQSGINSDKTMGRKPIVSIGSYGANLYPRGASVLHMLRFVLGEEMFWRAIQHYIAKYRFTTVETNDLKNAIEEATGQNLHWFFDRVGLQGRISGLRGLIGLDRFLAHRPGLRLPEADARFPHGDLPHAGGHRGHDRKRRDDTPCPGGPAGHRVHLPRSIHPHDGDLRQGELDTQRTEGDTVPRHVGTAGRAGFEPCRQIACIGASGFGGRLRHGHPGGHRTFPFRHFAVRTAWKQCRCSA